MRRIREASNLPGGKKMKLKRKAKSTKEIVSEKAQREQWDFQFLLKQI